MLTATDECIRDILGNELDSIIVCMETATALQGMSNLFTTNSILVYSNRDIKRDNLTVIKVESLDDIEYDNIRGIKCTTKLRTVRDLLNTSYNRDYQIICETLSNYYYKHGQSFEKLEEQLNEKQRLILEEFKQDAIEYYDD